MAIYYTYDGKYHKFYSYRQLINWLAMHNYHDYSPYDNSFLRRCGNNSNDSYVALEWENYRVRYPRDYRIYDEDWHAILNGGIIADAREATYNVTMEQGRMQRVRQDKEWQDALAQAGYPRPYTWRPWHERHPKSHSYGNYKHGASLRDFRYAADPEHAPYIRAARNRRNLPDAWDDKFNRCSTGWKNSTKYRHQWEARARREAAKQLAQQSSCYCLLFLVIQNQKIIERTIISMGIILILAIATVLLISGAFILIDHDHDGLALISGLGAVITGVPCIICIIVLIITAIGMPRELPSYQAQAAEYQALIDNPSSEDITFDALYSDIVKFNARVRQGQAKSESFWHKGLYSPLWYKVPLVDLHID